MIDVEYSCDQCGVKDAKVAVRSRGDTEPVLLWMDAVVAAIAADHHRKSPRCRATHITETKIPLAAGGGRIGDATAH